MKKIKIKRILKKHILNPILLCTLFYSSHSVVGIPSGELSNCNKLWGVTQDANGKMLYKVGMYMCIDDPYNIYKQSYLSTNTLPLIMNNTNYTNNTNLSQYQSHTNNTHTINNVSTNTPIPSNDTGTNISPNLRIKNVSNSSFLNHSRLIVNTSNVSSSTNLRSVISKNIKNTLNKDDTHNDSVTIIIIVICAVAVNLLIVVALYRRKRNKKIQQDKSDRPKKMDTLGTQEALNKPHTLNKQLNKSNKGSSKSFVPSLPSLPPPTMPPPGIVHYKTRKDRNGKDRQGKHGRNVTKMTFDVNSRTVKHLIHPPPSSISINTHMHKIQNKGELALGDTALTPNTKQILDESKKSVTTWYKKTFPGELLDSSNDTPLPESYAMRKSQPDKDGNVKLIQRNNYHRHDSIIDGSFAH